MLSDEICCAVYATSIFHTIFGTVAASQASSTDGIRGLPTFNSRLIITV
jgi:hypothetical protein